MSSSGSIFGDEPAPPRPRRGPRPISMVPPLCIFAVVISTGGEGLWKKLLPARSVPGQWLEAALGDGSLVGFVLALEWSFAQAGSVSDDTFLQHMRDESLRLVRADQHHGFIEYPVRAWLALDRGVRTGLQTVASLINEVANRPATSSSHPGRSILAGVLLREWSAAGATAGPIVRLAPAVAHAVLTGALKTLHCVAVTGRMNRNKLLNKFRPSRKQLKRLIASRGQHEAPEIPSEMPVVQPPRRSNAGWSGEAFAADLLVDWLEASSFVRQVAQANEAARAFSRIVARSIGADVGQTMGRLQKISPETLRRARVRLDCVAMALFRKLWFATIVACGDRPPDLYLFADASPQWRGLELYASSFDMYDGTTFVRKMFPMVSLDKNFQDAVGKAIALLWQVFLVAGPSYFLVRKFCERVRSITTDQGVERKLADFPPMLKEFYYLVDPKYNIRGKELSEELFPRAVAMPGWQHMWDLLLRRAFCSLAWFPQWLVGLKATIAFLRSTTNTVVVARSLRGKGLPGAAALVERARLPNFAEWRWGTLQIACNRLAEFLETLAANFTAAEFKDARDRTGITNMLSALHSQTWRRRFQLVLWVCNWLGGIMAWGRGCPCHEQELRQGAEVECHWKGRRLREAYGHARKELDRGLEEANSWTIDTWSLSAEDWLAGQACVRGVFALANRKIAFLDRLPYLLARLEEPGVRDRCLQQWAECEPKGHHRVSKEFLSPEKSLRSHVEAMAPDGTSMSEKLRREVSSMAAIPLDDSVAEGPHAIAHRNMTHARGAKWPWVASTMRLGQNLEDARGIPAAVDIELQPLWDQYKSVVRGPSCRKQVSQTSARMTNKKFEETLYCMSHFHEPGPGYRRIDDRALAADDEGDDDQEQPGPGDGGGGGGRHLKRRRVQEGQGPAEQADPDRSGEGQGEAVQDRVAAGRISPALDLRRRNPEEVKLLKQYFVACLSPGSFLSVPGPAEAEDTEQFFQILSLESKAIIVKTFTPMDSPPEDSLLNVVVQPMDLWNGNMTPEALVFPVGPEVRKDAFCVQEPCSVDIVLLCGGLENRHRWLKWQGGQSDIEGCVQLRSAEPLKPHMPLSSPNIPVLSLLDALHEQGWAHRDEKVLHDRVGWKVYDNRRISSQRCYLKCLVALADILPLVGPFPSGESGVYYQLLLKGRKKVELGLGAAAYRTLLAETEGDLLQLAALQAEQAPQLPPVEDRPQRQQQALVDADADSSVYGDEEGEAPTAGAGAAPPPPADEEDEVGDGVDQLELVPADVLWPTEVLGQRLRRVAGRSGGGWNYHARLSVSCSNPAHLQCTKSRSVALGAAVFGQMAPVLFLGAWLQKADMPEQQHRKYTPDRAAVQAFAASYSPE